MRIKLVLADEDKQYAESIGKYIRDQYSTKFSVSIFTRSDKLAAYLSENSGDVDALLINNALVNETIREVYNGYMAVLVEKDTDDCGDMPGIKKYQPADVIIQALMDACTESISGMDSLIRGSCKSSLLTVFSPQGGSGCTTISVYIAYCIAKAGARVLHLDFGSAPVSRLFGEKKDEKDGMSEIFYYLKDEGKKLPLKIDALKSYSSRWGFYYYNPAYNRMEIEEFCAADIGKLMNEFKKVGQFDYIIAATDSVFNERSLRIMMDSDKVVFTVERDYLYNWKFSSFMKELQHLKVMVKPDMTWNPVIVYNKCGRHDCQIPPIAVPSADIIEVPYCDDLYIKSDHGYVMNPESKICSYIEKLPKLLQWSGKHVG